MSTNHPRKYVRPTKKWKNGKPRLSATAPTSSTSRSPLPSDTLEGSLVLLSPSSQSNETQTKQTFGVKSILAVPPSALGSSPAMRTVVQELNHVESTTTVSASSERVARYSLQDIIEASSFSAESVIPESLFERIVRTSDQGFYNYLTSIGPIKAATVLTEMCIHLLSILDTSDNDQLARVLHVLYKLMDEMTRLVQGSFHLKAISYDEISDVREESAQFPVFSAYLNIEMQLRMIKFVLGPIHRLWDWDGQRIGIITVTPKDVFHDLEDILKEMSYFQGIRRLLCEKRPCSTVMELNERVLQLQVDENFRMGDDMELESKVLWLEQMTSSWTFRIL